MVKNIIKSSLSAVAVVMLLLCAVYEWSVAGYILMTVALLWFVCESTQFVLRGGWKFVIVACGTLAIVGFGVMFPVLLAGIGTGVGQCFFVFAALAVVTANAYVWSK